MYRSFIGNILFFSSAGIKFHDKVLAIGTGIKGHFIGDLLRTSGTSFVAVFKINELKFHKAKELKLFYAYLDWKCSKIYGKSQKNFERWI